MKKTSVALLTATALLGFAAPSSAQVDYHTEITGDQETPDTGSPATGIGTFVIDTVANTVDFDISFSGLIAAETAAHIHKAPPGVPGGILVPLPIGSPKIGQFFYSEPDEADLLAGNMYVNIHSLAFSGGEIRGQIVPTPISYCEGKAVAERQLNLVRAIVEEPGLIGNRAGDQDEVVCSYAAVAQAANLGRLPERAR